MTCSPESQRRIAAGKLRTPADVRNREEPIIAFSPEMRGFDIGLKRFLFERMYRHDRINRTMAHAKEVVGDLFRLHLESPDLLPPEWSRVAGSADRRQRARVVADYIAGMTDKFALETHARLLGSRVGCFRKILSESWL